MFSTATAQAISPNSHDTPTLTLITALCSSFGLTKPHSKSGPPAKATESDFNVAVQAILELHKQLLERDKSIEVLKERVDRLQEVLQDVRINRNLDVFKPRRDEDWDDDCLDDVRECENNFLNGVHREIQSAKSKENNIVIYGINESTKQTAEDKSSHDNERVQHLFNHISADRANIKKIVRLKNSNSSSKPPPLLVKLDSKATCISVLKSAKKLKQSKDLANIYISLDMTQAQRQELRSLIAVRNDLNTALEKTPDGKDSYYGIRNGKVVKLSRDRQQRVNPSNKK